MIGLKNEVKKVPVQINKIKIKMRFRKKIRSGRNINVFHTICFNFFLLLESTFLIQCMEC